MCIRDSASVGHEGQPLPSNDAKPRSHSGTSTTHSPRSMPRDPNDDPNAPGPAQVINQYEWYPWYYRVSPNIPISPDAPGPLPIPPAGYYPPSVPRRPPAVPRPMYSPGAFPQRPVNFIAYQEFKESEFESGESRKGK